jgi:hypothetical protein
VVYLMALSVLRLKLLWGEMDLDTGMRKSEMENTEILG